MTIYLPAELVERAKNAVYWTPGLTLKRLAARGLQRAVEELERSRGDTFPPREHELTGGHPMG